MSVASVCRRDVETARPAETAAEVARRMTVRRVGSVVVVDEQSRPMGILSDRDITTRVVAGGRDPQCTPIIDVMSPMPTTVLENTSIENALGHMRVGHLRRLPVVNGMDRVVGIVTLDDILRLLAEELSTIEGLIDAEAPRHEAGAGGMA
jgi:CBS domain-containing protein